MRVNVALALLTALLCACGSPAAPRPVGQTPASPTSPTPPTPPTPPAPQGPQNYETIVGEYDLTAPITGFDPIWGDLTGHRFVAVLTLFHGEGTHTGLKVLNPQGEQAEPGRSGRVSRSTIDSGIYTGYLLMTLGNDTNLPFQAVLRVIAEPNGNAMASPRLEGTFGHAGHIGGTFVAVRRMP